MYQVYKDYTFVRNITEQKNRKTKSKNKNEFKICV